jgi:IclR family transcriptional regulator, pca regulon regulatory protein
MTARKQKTTAEQLERPDDEEGRSISKSLVRGLAILACFTPEHPLLGISDLADRLGASRSTTHRYACTLVELGYLEQDSSRRYHLGLRAADLGISVLASLELRRRAVPHLRELRDATTHSVSLTVLDRTEVFVLERLASHLSAVEQLAMPIGQSSRLPAHCTATGKLLLAMADLGAPPRLPRELKLTRGGPHTITVKRELCAELEQIRVVGLALEDEELRAGARSLAAPVYDGEGTVIAAVAVSLPSSACPAEELHARFAGALSDVAERISAETGPGDLHRYPRGMLPEPASARSVSRSVGWVPEL